jgi:hypothetical protein
MPKWAKSAATVLSDKQLLFKQNEGGHACSHPPSNPPGLSESDHATDSGIAKSERETVGGTVSRKEKFGFTCESCSWVPAKGGLDDWVTTHTGRYVGLHFPHRCRRCASRMKRWTTAARNYDQLEILRVLEGRHCLRFLTLTKEEWNVKVPVSGLPLPESDSEPTSPTLWGEAEKLKKIATRQFRNWRNRNKYWQSREAKGQCYYEVTMKPVWNGWGFDEVQLHFHIHMVVCSKRIENKDIQIDLDTLEPIPMSTTIQREWGGIVDVRKCRTWKHKDIEKKRRHELPGRLHQQESPLAIN